MEQPIENDRPATGPWSVKDVSQNEPDDTDTDTVQIVYISCVSPILVAAFLEWFLWLAAFFYCLAKAFKKADRWSQRTLALLMFLIFLIIRSESVSCNQDNELTIIGASSYLS